VQTVADGAAHALQFYEKRFGPYPYNALAETQIPGALSQSWPELIFLSSFSFLNPVERQQLRMPPVDLILTQTVVYHETAHQWWGDLVGWSSYRDQWISEALANYSALMLLESENPEQFRAVMEKYRQDLLEKNKAGNQLLEAGPVTLGSRLSSSHFPDGYEAISYGRGTWLLHMLRSMMRDANANKPRSKTGTDEEAFIRALRKVRERYEGKSITTRDLLQVFAEELPPSLWYEGHKSLDWFYQGWVNGTAVPHFELQSVKYIDKAGSTLVSGSIVQKSSAKDLVTPVPLYAVLGNKAVFVGQVFVDGPETPFQLKAPLGARKLVLDPAGTLLTRR
jgi:aminopeptidase N